MMSTNRSNTGIKIHDVSSELYETQEKGYAKQKATFLKIEDAVFWEQHVKKNLTQWTLRLLSTNLPQTIDPVYINRVKQMSDMSYTLEQFEQDKQTLLNLIADCEELEMKENGDQFFIQCDEFNQTEYTV